MERPRSNANPDKHIAYIKYTRDEIKKKMLKHNITFEHISQIDLLPINIKILYSEYFNTFTEEHKQINRKKKEKNKLIEKELKVIHKAQERLLKLGKRIKTDVSSDDEDL